MKKISPSNPEITDLKPNQARKKMKDAAFARLWAKAGGRCEFKGCNCKLYEDNVTLQNNNHGQVAHIIAFSPKGTRGDKELSAALDGKDENAMLMCGQHHHLIDHEEAEFYTVDRLRKMKQWHENRMEYLQSLNTAEQSMALVYFAKTSKDCPLVTPTAVKDAILSNGYFPHDSIPINLAEGDLGLFDNEQEYWSHEEQRLQRGFDRYLSSIHGITTEGKRLAVFAIAPQPLLVKLGSLIGSLRNVDVYQKHREPKETWEWLNIEAKNNLFIAEPREKANGAPTLIFAISADAIVDNVVSQLGEKSENIWVVRAEDPKFTWCTSKEHQALFRDKARSVLNLIKKKCPSEDIHVYMAVPNSLAVEFGRLWMPKADASLLLYDIDRETKLYNMVLKIVN